MSEDKPNIDITTTLDQIINNEQNNNAMLKEKREVEETVVALNRKIKELVSRTESSEREKQQYITKSDELRVKLELAKVKLEALTEQVKHAKEIHLEIRKNVENGISDVWELRKTLSRATEDMSTKYDIWALLMKPIPSNTNQTVIKMEVDEPMVDNVDRLKVAMEKRNRVIAKRNRLRAEPDVADEFVRKYLQLVTKNQQCFCTKIKDHEPIKFSATLAARRRIVAPIRAPQDNSMPWYQLYVVTGSVVVFLLYFCVFREESDIDLEFNKTLYDRIKGLEKTQLIQTYKFNKEHGKDTADVERRLKEIEAEAQQS